jgi:hypothetical protein
MAMSGRDHWNERASWPIVLVPLIHRKNDGPPFSPLTSGGARLIVCPAREVGRELVRHEGHTGSTRRASAREDSRLVRPAARLRRRTTRELI